ncbi:hypothetical protein MKZ38_009898 [Zalerion maritima]|uniref:Uncharacterized protein n=1 Tax=Zalerion maritima TaxID=339359 RepID=A0AAD5RGA3_9PEZI|nr:hypothetical protein MKZ38_009898 [Zalerion maritima]
MSGLGSNPNRAHTNQLTRTNIDRLPRLEREGTAAPSSRLPRYLGRVRIWRPHGRTVLVDVGYGPWAAAFIAEDLARMLRAEFIPERPCCPAVNFVASYVPEYFTTLHVQFPAGGAPAMEENFKIFSPTEFPLSTKIFLPMNHQWADGTRILPSMGVLPAAGAPMPGTIGPLSDRPNVELPVNDPDNDPDNDPPRVLVRPSSPEAPAATRQDEFSAANTEAPHNDNLASPALTPGERPAGPESTNVSTVSDGGSPSTVPQSQSSVTTAHFCPCCQKHCLPRIKAELEAETRDPEAEGMAS